MRGRLIGLVVLALAVTPVGGAAGERAPAGDPATANSSARTADSRSADRWIGEPISLSLKDADLKDVLKTFAELTDLNIVVHPFVEGSVTVELRDVPWDQALELILEVNGLGWEARGKVIYVAPWRELSRTSRS